MKKTVLALMVLLNLTQAQEHVINTYTLTVETDSTKVDGKSWDILGGAPDILIKVNGVYLNFDKKCKDSYRCNVEFTTENKTSWYFEIYDKDFDNNDLIAKGECSVGKECRLKGATITIK